MSEIDWSKAPEGATHWEPDTGRAVSGWMKLEKGNWFYWPVKTDSPSWHFSGGLTEQRVISMIPRPSLSWSGEGLPPVGLIIEWLDGERTPVEVVAHYRGSVIAVDPKSPRNIYSGKKQCYRPIRTPEQIAAEEMEAAIKAACDDIRHTMQAVCGFSEPQGSALAIVRAMIEKGYRKQEGK